jgi:hypothetical protein
MLEYLYQYLVGGAIFLVGFLYVWRQGDVGFRDSRTRKNTLLLIGGFALFALVHAFFQFIAPGITLAAP